MARTKLDAGDVVEVIDWADYGDWAEVLTEDGPAARPPAHRAVILLTTTAGRVYSLSQNDFDQADSVARWIRGHGSVDLDKWEQERTIYGSDAYVADRCEAKQAAWERAQG